MSKMGDISSQQNEIMDTWTEDEVFDFMAEHFSEEIASKFKGKPGTCSVFSFTFAFLVESPENLLSPKSYA